MKKTFGFIALSVALTAVAVMNFSGAVSGSDFRSKAQPESRVFESFSAFSAAEIEENIRRAEEERRANEEIESVLDELDDGSMSNRRIFANTCFVGDSLMNGLEVYEILDSDMLMTQVSASLDHLSDCVDSIIAKNPQNLILHYGINMLSEYDYGRESFIEYYTELVTELKNALPSTRIIVSSIFSVDPEAEMEAVFDKIPEYNKALKEMCTKLNVEFLDSTDLLAKCLDYYSGDGIHLDPSFYSDKWLPFIVEDKGIVG